jgi:hypothetical protein
LRKPEGSEGSKDSLSNKREAYSWKDPGIFFEISEGNKVFLLQDVLMTGQS